MMTATPATAVPTPECFGRAATIVGTGDDDVLRGTPGSDVIAGLEGDDRIIGLRGDDYLCGGPGDDTILGGAGNDRIRGDDGNDTMFAGLGDDFVYGNAGDDKMNGRDGSDTMLGGTGNDVLSGNAGDDPKLDGGPGNDRINGGLGIDVLIGGLGNDLLRGRPGDDTLDGGSGTDRLYGGADTDLCINGEILSGCEPPPGAGTPTEIARTISFRTVLAWQDTIYPEPVAGRYVTLSNEFADWRHMYDDAADNPTVTAILRPQTEPNPILVEYGVFPTEGGRVRLLATNGLWVKLKNGTAMANGWTWDDANQFTIVPAEVTSTVRTELESADPPIPTDGLMCIETHSPTGQHLGYLGVAQADNGTRSLELIDVATCGSRTDTLFHTDLADGADAHEPVPADLRDPLMHVRFVPPDYPALPFRADWDRRRDATQSIDIYFNTLKDDVGLVHDFTETRLEQIVNWVSITGYTSPDPPKTDVVSMLLGGIFGLGSAIPEIGPAFAAVGGLFFIVSAGITAADEANREEPRLIESMTNSVRYADNELRKKLTEYLSQTGRRIDELHGRIVAGCATNRSGPCISQRAMAAWLDQEPIIPDQRTLMAETLAASFEREMWPIMLKTRGLLWAPVGDGYGDWEAGECDSGVHEALGPWLPYFYYTRTNREGQPYVDPVDQSHVTPTLVVTVNCEEDERELGQWGESWYRDVIRSYAIGLRNDDGPPIALSQEAVDRLFGTNNPEDPIFGGLGFSKRDIACLFDEAKPDDVQGFPHERRVDPEGGSYPIWDVTNHACRFRYTTATGTHWEPPWEYVYRSPTNIPADAYRGPLQYKPPMFALWVPDQAVLEDGRVPISPDGAISVKHDPNGIVPDPDVVPAQEPRAAWTSCSEDEVTSASSGTATSIYFLNVSGDEMTVLPIGSNATYVVPPLPNGGFHLVTNTDVYGSALVEIATHVGQTFEVAGGPDGRCLGRWTATVGDYSVAEVHDRVEN